MLTKTGCILSILVGLWVFPVSSDALTEVYRGPQEHWPAPHIDKGAQYSPLAPLPVQPPYPPENPYSAEKRELGKYLFFDRRLSKSQQIACANCHDPDLGWADGRRKSIGHNRQVHTLNTPSVVNSAYLSSVFWDGRVNTLEQQVVQSWSNPIEMAASLSAATARISELHDYLPLFEKAFGTAQVTTSRITNAITTYVRSLTLTNTRFDRFLRGERHALSDAEIHGLHLFRTKARCINCHNGAQLSDNKFHHLGTSFQAVGNFEGRYRVTGQATDVGAFRTPNLRGLNHTAPYMHNGLISNLDNLLALYNAGWWQNAPLHDTKNTVPLATLSPLIQPLKLTKTEMHDLRAFLDTLSGTMPFTTPPNELN
ncbi:cytochrome-c peroxidase [Alteromonas sp. 14N.309.X.WAT.G.H12]|uniref:cytochrome-c peroxidase n=1 Tax=Alteromonas sp. 14N.309.X.WAT.G.H12 TaxID=3120824 RepID=UPI002FD002CD